MMVITGGIDWIRRLLFLLFLIVFIGCMNGEHIQTPPLLGIEIGTTPPSVNEEFDLPQSPGAYVYNVMAGSIAQRNGILPGDILLRKDGQWIHDPPELQAMMKSAAGHARISFTLLRPGSDENSIRHISLRLNNSGPAVEGSRYWPGFIPVSLPPEIKGQLGIDASIGTMIIGSTNHDSPAAASGIRTGDIIQSIEGEKVTDTMDLYRILNNAGDSFVVRVYRQGRYYNIRIERPYTE